MAVEGLANSLGNPGRLQMIVYLLLCCNTLFVSWNHLAMAFMGAKTRHHCSLQNNTDIDRLVPTIKKNGKNDWDGCKVFAHFNTTQKRSCDNGWTYYLPRREKTIASQWDLVCDDAYKGPLSATIYFCGVMLGGLVFGPISDKFGRKPVLLFTVYSPAVIGIAIFLLQKSYVGFVILRFFLGFVLQGLQSASFTIIVEQFAARYRGTLGTTLSVFWSFGVMSLALISFVIQDWRYIQLFITVITVTQISLVWLLSESFRWLLAEQQFDKAERVVKKIAKFNGLPYPRDSFEQATQIITENKVDASEKKYTVIDMFRFPVLRLRSLIMVWVWFSTSVGYYGISLNISSLAGNKYLNFFIGGVLELFAYIFTVFVTRRYGRRKPLCIYLMVGSIMCIVAGVLSENKGDHTIEGLTTGLAIIGKVGFAGSFCVLFIYTSELFPTVIRNVGLGACASWARFGGIVAPQVLLLGNHTRRSVPLILFGCCAFVGSLISLFLPETLNAALVDTIEEVGKMKEGTKAGELTLCIEVNDEDQVSTEKL